MKSQQQLVRSHQMKFANRMKLTFHFVRIQSNLLYNIITILADYKLWKSKLITLHLNNLVTAMTRSWWKKAEALESSIMLSFDVRNSVRLLNECDMDAYSSVYLRLWSECRLTWNFARISVENLPFKFNVKLSYDYWNSSMGTKSKLNWIWTVSIHWLVRTWTCTLLIIFLFSARNMLLLLANGMCDAPTSYDEIGSRQHLDHIRVVYMRQLLPCWLRYNAKLIFLCLWYLWFASSSTLRALSKQFAEV